MQDIFKNVWEQQKYSELKNGVLLTFNIALFIILARLSSNAISEITCNLSYKIIFYILIILFVFHLYFIIQSYFPKDSNKEEIKWTADEINIFFFGDIQKLESDKFLDIVLEKTSENSFSKKDKSFLLNLSNQIVKISEITQSKYSSFKNSILRTYVLSVLFLIYFTVLFFL